MVSAARHEFVVVDTAPTGHTLLLLDAAGSYHRDIVRQMGATDGFRTPMMMLQDPELTKVVLVTLPEPTPVTEARVLQDDLERAGIHPWAWVVNMSLAAAQPTVGVPAAAGRGRGRADRGVESWPTGSRSCPC